MRRESLQHRAKAICAYVSVGHIIRCRYSSETQNCHERLANTFVGPVVKIIYTSYSSCSTFIIQNLERADFALNDLKSIWYMCLSWVILRLMPSRCSLPNELNSFYTKDHNTSVDKKVYYVAALPRSLQLTPL